MDHLILAVVILILIIIALCFIVNGQHEDMSKLVKQFTKYKEDVGDIKRTKELVNKQKILLEEKDKMLDKKAAIIIATGERL